MLPVPVAGESIHDETAEEFHQKMKATYKELREAHEAKQQSKKMATYEEAKANYTVIDWENYKPIKPAKVGETVLDLDLNILRNYIDWTPFFSTWMLAGKFPKILEDKVVGKEAKKLYDEANAMLDQIIAEKWLAAKAVVGLYPVRRMGDDLIILDEKFHETPYEFHFLRQQGKKGKGVPNRSLIDFIHPDQVDYFGGFAVTAGLNMDGKVAEFKAKGDDYNEIMFKALGDRLAEAAAEYTHELVRKELWGYVGKESFDNEALIKEAYTGIRPAPGYPACPEHSEKITLFELLNAEENIGVSLTESFAMVPTSSVSGFYFANPESKYFGLGKIGEDQVANYAKRKGVSKEQAERWLSPNLAYQPKLNSVVE